MPSLGCASAGWSDCFFVPVAQSNSSTIGLPVKKPDVTGSLPPQASVAPAASNASARTPPTSLISTNPFTLGRAYSTLASSCATRCRASPNG